MEIETWLQRMENRAERMGGIATTADILEAQQKEQKVIMKLSFNETLKIKSNFYLLIFSPSMPNCISINIMLNCLINSRKS